MKIPHHKADSFIKSLDQNTRGVLIYGPDAGLVSHRAKDLRKTLKPDGFNFHTYTYDKVKEDSARIMDTLHSISLTGGRQIVEISTNSAVLNEKYKSAIGNYKGEGFLIFLAGDLTPSSSLRKIFESSSIMAAIGCYKDDLASIRNIIRQKFGESGTSYTPEALSILESSISGDRMLIESEIDKLITYVADKKNVDAADALICSGANLDTTLDKLCFSIAESNLDKALANFACLKGEGINEVAIIRSMSRFFTRLYSARIKKEAGADDKQALSGLRPPVFFKDIPSYTRYIQKYPSKRIAKIIERLAKVEGECKKTGTPVELLCERLIMNLSHTVS